MAPKKQKNKIINDDKNIIPPSNELENKMEKTNNNEKIGDQLHISQENKDDDKEISINCKEYWKNNIVPSENQIKIQNLLNTDKMKLCTIFNVADNNVPDNVPTDNYIYVNENVIDKLLCNEIIELFEMDNLKTRGRVGNGIIDIDVKKTYDLAFSHSEKWKSYDKILFDILSKNISDYFISLYDYNPATISTFLNTNMFDNGCQIQKYEKNTGFYKWHTDLKKGDGSNRFITFILYLNDVDEGGETLFVNGKIKPTVGKLLFFPATWTYMHRGNMPISSDKYIITGWFSLPE